MTTSRRTAGGFRCAHYVMSPELGSHRLEIRRVAAADAHTALCWVVARGFDVADQLDPPAARAVIQAVQDTVMHAELLAALEAGHGYGLPLSAGAETHTFEVRQPRRADVERPAPEAPAGLPLLRAVPLADRAAVTCTGVAGGAS